LRRLDGRLGRAVDEEKLVAERRCPCRENLVEDTHVGQPADQPVAAEEVRRHGGRREAAGLENEDCQAAGSEVGRREGPCDPAAHDDDVMLVPDLRHRLTSRG
jgi:hypothetical protein